MPAPTVNGIPQELLREILKYEFDDTAFSLHHTFKSFRPFFSKQRTSKPCHLLLVCKRWLHVATPLFYETVELGTEKHVAQLARAIIRNPGIAGMVRHLRIDGGYQAQLYDVVRHMRNVRTLSVQTALMSRMSNAGLFRGLPRLNPTTLYLHTESGMPIEGNRKTRETTRMIWRAAMQWTVLEQIIFCTIGGITVSPDFLDVVATSPSLRTIGASEWPLACLLRDSSFCAAVQIGKEPKILKCYDPDKCLDNFMMRAGVPQKIQNSVVYEHIPGSFDWFLAPLRESPSLML